MNYILFDNNGEEIATFRRRIPLDLVGTFTARGWSIEAEVV